MSSKGHVLITGGAGFLGSHLCGRLVADGYEVRCLDSFLTGSLENLGHIIEHPRFALVRHDVTEPIEVEGPLDFILHLASPASPKDYAKYPIHTLTAGALGTYNTLELAKAKRAVFLLASSSEVYGSPEVNPQHEGYWGHVNPVGPRSVYAEAKRFAEAIAVAYQRKHGLDVRIARLFNVFGPRMRPDDGRALPTFMMQALRNEPLTVYGDGSQTRSYCYVDDIVEALCRLMLVTPDARLPGEELILNLGNPDEISVLQLAREVRDAVNSRGQIVFEPLPQDDPRIRRPDIARARQLLGWTPKVTRLEGLRRVVPYFRSTLPTLANPSANA